MEEGRDFLEAFDEENAFESTAQGFEILAGMESSRAEHSMRSCRFGGESIMTEVADDQCLLSVNPVLLYELLEDGCLIARIADDAGKEMREVVPGQFLHEDILGAPADQVLPLHHARCFPESVPGIREEMRMLAPFFHSAPENAIQVVLGNVRRNAVPLIEFHVVVGDFAAVCFKRWTGESEVPENPPYAPFEDVHCIILERPVPVPDGEAVWEHDERV